MTVHFFFIFLLRPVFKGFFHAAALADLEHALRLSNSGGRSGCKALCQRGLLRRKVKNVDGAKEDFSAAARLGSKFARNQLVELNPYAALCNQMLREAFDKLA